MKKNILITVLLGLCATLSFCYYQQTKEVNHLVVEKNQLRDSLFKKSYMKISRDKFWFYRTNVLHHSQPFYKEQE